MSRPEPEARDAAIPPRLEAGRVVSVGGCFSGVGAHAHRLPSRLRAPIRAASDPGLTARLQRLLPRDFGIPAAAAHELFYGAYKSQQTGHNLARMDALQFEGAGVRQGRRQAGW